MEYQRLDIVELINNSPLTKLSKEFQTKLLSNIQEHFTDNQQQLFVASFYSYLNYNSKTDFVINLDDVWKWCGFSRKGNSKRILEKHFCKDIDYKILLLNSEKQVHGGSNKEAVFLNIETFKSLCMLAGTSKSKEIRQYYLKLEELLHDTMKEQLEEKERQLEEKNKTLEEQSKLLEQLENKPHTEGFERTSGSIYLVKDASKPGHYKIGFANDPQKRISQLNTASSTYSLEIVCRFETFDKEFAEKIIHYSLNPLKIKNRKEWFYLKNDFELAYAIHTIKTCIQFIEQYNIISYQQLNEIDDINVNLQLEEINKDNRLKELIKQDIIKKCQLSAQQMSNKTGNYKGVCWCASKEKWKAELKKNYTISFLGYFDNEIHAAKAYNDYATFLNQTQNDTYTLNYISDYIPNSRDIPSESKQTQEENKTSKYIGVSYDYKRNYYVVSIKHNRKTYHLGNNKDELECAKLYNQQALYFNNQFNTSYELNDIPGYTTIEKNIFKEIQVSKLSSKSSKYYGVTFAKQKNKYRAVIVYNKKQLHLGFFDEELEAAKAYNKKASELNEQNAFKYKINNVEATRSLPLW